MQCKKDINFLWMWFKNKSCLKTNNHLHVAYKQYELSMWKLLGGQFHFVGTCVYGNHFEGISCI